MAQQTEPVVETVTESAPQDETEELTAEELIEDVSIDGMCGVY